MTFKFLASVLFVFPSLMAIVGFSARPATASCVMTDIALQLQISGTQQSGQQVNNVGMAVDGPCWGNTTTNVQSQIYTGAGDATQIRDSNHLVGGSDSVGSSFDGPVIGTSIYVPLDIYSPAHDANFMESLGLP